MNKCMSVKDLVMEIRGRVLENLERDMDNIEITIMYKNLYRNYPEGYMEEYSVLSKENLTIDETTRTLLARHTRDIVLGVLCGKTLAEYLDESTMLEVSLAESVLANIENLRAICVKEKGRVRGVKFTSMRRGE